ncbi:hypothetical protein [Flavobacterium taihuense]|uniref:Hyaluronidase n=1 Tax=Flavobacterium taihuense TaxID=2857508 RepID=A0ABS6XUJ7_9FLAO|nr:hypothetical protein [Flavobacterium taihuense]MBW4360345.1 hypothetical protein [Flavobacterium taihuense]
MISTYIDPKKTGKVDKELFIKVINRYYPDSLANGILCIDLENEAYSNLLKFDSETFEFREASAQFTWMIKTVKKMCPNVKVGVYALPFRTYYANSHMNSRKLDAILSLSDYIFPSLYTMYPDSQIGKSRNQKYLRENLEFALDYGVRLNKPVVPFIWNLVHPSNKLYGGQLVSKEEVLQNITFIRNFKYKNKSVQGIVWWDPDHKSFSKMNKTDVKIEGKEPKYIQSELLKDYLDSFIK